MAQTQGSNGRGVSSNDIASQLAAIAGKLTAIESQWRDDVATIKTVMFGKTTSNQAPPPAPSTPLTLTNYGATATHINTKSAHNHHSSIQANALHDQKTPREPNLSTIIITINPPPTPATSLISAPNITPNSASKPAPKPAWNATHRHHKLSPETACAHTKNRTHTSPPWGSSDEKDMEIARVQAILAHRWVYEAGQPTIEWLIAWCNNSLKEATRKMYDLFAHHFSYIRLEDKSCLRAGSIDTNPYLDPGQNGSSLTQLLLDKGKRRVGRKLDGWKEIEGADMVGIECHKFKKFKKWEVTDI